MEYDGKIVTYWYRDHKSKVKKVETVPVFIFIGRMVQHILVKGFKRGRYYGLQATKSFSKWCDEAIVDAEIGSAKFNGYYYDGFCLYCTALLVTRK